MILARSYSPEFMLKNFTKVLDCKAYQPETTIEPTTEQSTEPVTEPTTEPTTLVIPTTEPATTHTLSWPG